MVKKVLKIPFLNLSPAYAKTLQVQCENSPLSKISPDQLKLYKSMMNSMWVVDSGENELPQQEEIMVEDIMDNPELKRKIDKRAKILRIVVTAMGYDPDRMPSRKINKKGIHAECKAACPRLFECSFSTFIDAWKKAKKDKILATLIESEPD